MAFIRAWKLLAAAGSPAPEGSAVPSGTTLHVSVVRLPWVGAGITPLVAVWLQRPASWNRCRLVAGSGTREYARSTSSAGVPGAKQMSRLFAAAWTDGAAERRRGRARDRSAREGLALSQPRSDFAWDQWMRGTIGESKEKPVEGSRATVFPERSPKRPSFVMVIAPDTPGATVWVWRTRVFLADRLKGLEAVKVPFGSQNRTVPVMA